MFSIPAKAMSSPDLFMTGDAIQIRSCEERYLKGALAYQDNEFPLSVSGVERILLLLASPLMGED
jgi:hypothetical protein